MPLCPECFNAPAYCECEPRFAPTGNELAHQLGRPSAAAERETADKLLQEVDPERRGLLNDIVAGLIAGGAWLETPPAEKPNYVNVRVPYQYGQARLCAITRSTGRLEFHDESFPVAEQHGLAQRFDHLAAGDKAAITPNDADDVAAILAVARVVMASRRASR